MAYYAVIYTYADDAVAMDENRPAHRAYLSELAARDQLVASGPMLGTSPATALILLRAESEEQVRALLAGDPFQQLGLVARTDVAEWNPVIGVLAGRD
ncbi:YciI family protein [Luteococcus peritonei]|uniref:YciI family protein n=1 Tax=Luteococcus peritonei TaxID=88874 RepID=A0ABW4RSQ9_9ACTN